MSAASASTSTSLAAANPAPLILASGSRFRRRMLQDARVTFHVVTAAIDEPAARADMQRNAPATTPGEIARRLAELKALAVSRLHPHSLIIGADQVLECDGEIYGKPRDQVEARAQLKSLRNRTHTLPTAVVLALDGCIVWHHLAIATLTMRDFSDIFLDTYLATAGPIVTETVGGYALEGMGAQLFAQVDGDYFTVIGLPLIPLLTELRRRDVLME